MRGVDQDRERQARAHVRARLRDYSWLFSSEGNEKFYRAHMEAADDETLVELARAGEKTALGILRKRLRLWHEAALRQGQTSLNVPTCAHELALEVFLYGPPRSKSGPNPMRKGLRNLSIALLVQTVHADYGFPIDVNPQHRNNADAPLTAIRLVAEELGLSEAAVDKIWRDRKAMVRRRWR